MMIMFNSYPVDVFLGQREWLLEGVFCLWEDEDLSQVGNNRYTEGDLKVLEFKPFLFYLLAYLIQMHMTVLVDSLANGAQSLLERAHFLIQQRAIVWQGEISDTVKR